MDDRDELVAALLAESEQIREALLDMSDRLASYVEDLRVEVAAHQCERQRHE